MSFIRGARLKDQRQISELESELRGARLIIAAILRQRERPELRIGRRCLLAAEKEDVLISFIDPQTDELVFRLSGSGVEQ